MFDQLTPKALVGIWFLVVATALVIGSALGLRLGLATSVLIFSAAAAPAVIALFVSRDSAPSTVAELIHDVEAHR